MIDIQSFYDKYFKPGNVFTDTRKTIKEGIFIALKGDNFNGNAFANAAINSGALVSIIDDPDFKKNESFILVDNSLDFLQKLSLYHRQSAGFKVIAITGTNGKTTTKELIRSVLSEKYICQATEGNLNNHIGVPLTLLSMQFDTQFAIIEMGANHPGEIKQLCEIALPDYGLITNIGKAHLEGFGTFEGVIKTKSELYDFIISSNGCIFYNALNPILANLVNDYHRAIKYNNQGGINGSIISNEPALTVQINISGNNSLKVNTNLYGEYNFENILACACVGNEFGLNMDQIRKGIEKYKPDNNRSQVLKKGTNTIILDCYNANPSSMFEAISSFGKISNHAKIIILGSMKELGVYSEDEHRKLIDILKNYKFEEVILIGEEFKHIKVSHFKYFENQMSLTHYLKNTKYMNKHILIKGSRANKLERIIEFLD